MLATSPEPLVMFPENDDGIGEMQVICMTQVMVTAICDGRYRGQWQNGSGL